MVKELKRNIVNFDELNKKLEDLAVLFDNPLYKSFIKRSVKNFFLQSGEITSAPVFLTYSFPGPYHVLTFSEMPEITKVCESVILKILKKEIKTELETTQIQLNKLIEPCFEYIGDSNNYSVYKANTIKHVNLIGEKLHNCLKSKLSIQEGESFFVFKKGAEYKMVVAMFDGNIADIKIDSDKSPSSEELNECLSFFKNKEFKVLKRSSHIASSLLVFVSIIGYFSIDYPFLIWFGLLLLIIQFWYTVNLALDPLSISKSIKLLKLEKVFYENVKN